MRRPFRWVDMFSPEGGIPMSTFVCCDGHQLPFREKSFDFVSMFSALHHFSDPAAVLTKAARLLRHNAFMAVMCEPVGHYLSWKTR